MTDGERGDAAARRRAVRERYAGVATGDDGVGAGTSGAADGGCCGPAATDADDGGSAADADADDTGTGCCGPADPVSGPADDDTGTGDDACCGPTDPDEVADRLGYDDADLAAAGAANLGLGCGNPGAIASLRPGETVLDLGSGGGFDCFLAADAVGPSGRVVGVDMTPEMVERARATAADRNRNRGEEAPDAAPVEFRLGEIEHLPVADGVVDVVISNCVINLSPDKAQVFREAFRALRPGGRLAVSDVVATAEVPDDVRADLAAVSGCVGGAAPVAAVERLLEEAGFVDVAVEIDGDEGGESGSREDASDGGDASDSGNGGEPASDGDDGDGTGIVDGWATGSSGDRPPSAYVAPASITARKPSGDGGDGLGGAEGTDHSGDDRDDADGRDADDGRDDPDDGRDDADGRDADDGGAE